MFSRRNQSAEEENRSRQVIPDEEQEGMIGYELLKLGNYPSSGSSFGAFLVHLDKSFVDDFLYIIYPICSLPLLAMPEKSRVLKARLLPIALSVFLSLIPGVISNFGKLTSICSVCSLSKADVTDL